MIRGSTAMWVTNPGGGSGHRGEGRPRADVDLSEPVEQLRRATLGDAGGAVDDGVVAHPDRIRGACLERRARRAGRARCSRLSGAGSRCPETISSSSIPIQTMVTCGLSSAFSVTRCASGPDSIRSRSGSGIAAIAGDSRPARDPSGPGRWKASSACSAETGRVIVSWVTGWCTSMPTLFSLASHGLPQSRVGPASAGAPRRCDCDLSDAVGRGLGSQTRPQS